MPEARITLYLGRMRSGGAAFGLGLLLLTVSAVSIWEIQISVHALNLHLSDIEEGERRQTGVH